VPCFLTLKLSLLKYHLQEVSAFATKTMTMFRIRNILQLTVAEKRMVHL
jgi:hypothetical protein